MSAESADQMVGQSIYSKLSREIGWEERRVVIPNDITARMYISQAKEGSYSAFRELFLLVRFAKSQTAAEHAIMEAINAEFYSIRGRFMRISK